MITVREWARSHPVAEDLRLHGFVAVTATYSSGPAHDEETEYLHLVIMDPKYPDKVKMEARISAELLHRLSKYEYIAGLCAAMHGRDVSPLGRVTTYRYVDP